MILCFLISVKSYLPELTYLCNVYDTLINRPHRALFNNHPFTWAITM